MRPHSLAPLLLLMPGAASAQATTVPTDIQLPGTQPGQVILESATRCDNCHSGYDPAVEPVTNWRGSLMAQAGRDPLFWATVAVAEQDFSGAGDLCLRCHAPEGWVEGRSTPTDGSGLRASDAQGVSCDVCHQLTNPDDSEHLGVQVEPFVANDGGTPPRGYYGSGMYVLNEGGEKLGPYSDPFSPHQALPSDFHRSSDLCGTCHDVSNPAVGDLAHNHGAMTPLVPGTFSGVPGASVEQKAAFNNFPYRYGVVERTYSEHRASDLSTLLVAHYGTLPEELRAGAIRKAYEDALASTPSGNYADGDPRTFTCQSCHLPPVTGTGCDRANAPVRTDLPLHDMTGANTWVPAAIVELDDQGRLVIGGGLDLLSRQALAAGVARARGNLLRAAGLDVSGNAVRVVNLTGHKLISGYPEGRRMWLRVVWRDPAQRVLREDGAYGPLQVLIDGVPAGVESILDLESPHLRLYAAHFGLTQQWASQLVALGYDPDLPLTYDREDGTVAVTLGELAAAPPGSQHESFRFVLNNCVVSDTRIPPYGITRAEAVERNIQPVPPEQYGDPQGAEAYDHFDTVDLAPPVGAVSGEIELLYQTTSWEYVQFLYLSNLGSGFLADSGDALLDAWLATGMSAPEVMNTAQWTALPDDCNNNGVPDAQDIAGGSSQDCNADGLPDECNIAWGASRDENGNGVPDECERTKIRRARSPLDTTTPGD